MSNRLINESSPYLLQHAHNPVDWYPWGQEAFSRARQENKPLLVSIGYATCHWCHVMERESFEDPHIADFMNQHFINIKVDREERPDIDNIYMEVVQLISGNGGWPLNCFILPDGRAFFAGTYFPPRNAYGRASWSQVLSNIQAAHSQRPHEVEEQATVIASYLQKSTQNFVKPLADFAGQPQFTKTRIERIFDQLSQNFDPNEGGFGGAPKFPSTLALRFCLQYAHDGEHSPQALQHLHLSLQKMLLGGIYDQIGGGLARYAVDSIWFVPHFEKMLYDNALLLRLLANTQIHQRNPLYSQAIAQTFQWLQREMHHPQGGYFSALDADSEGVEGKFYVWTHSEIQQLLPPHLAQLCSNFYNLKADGNWEHQQNILSRHLSPTDYAAKHQLHPDTLQQNIQTINDTLLATRQKRIPPSLDDKMLLDWNALLATALAHCYHATQNHDYKKAALDLVDFLDKTFAQTDGLQRWHTYKANHQAKIEAFLDDYAFWIEALLSAYSLNFDLAYLRKAEALADWVLANFWDESEHNFFFAAANSQLVVRPKDLYDNATPSGNAVMLDCLQKLGHLLSRPDFLDRTAQSLGRMQDSIEKYPQSFGRWASALWQATWPMREIVVVGPNAHSIAQELQRHPLGNAVVLASLTGLENLDLLEGRQPKTTETQIYICIDKACRQPVSTVPEALALLG